jgi:hypothetical protein
LVPVVTLAGFGLYDLAIGEGIPVVWFEASIELGLMLVVYAAFACMLGLQMSLQFKRTVHAVLTTIGILMAVSLALGGCGYGLLGISDEFGAVLAAFTPLTAVSMIVDPIGTLGMEAATTPKLLEVRLLLPIGVGLAAGFYAAIVTGMYRSMIRNFDMTVRKQSA